MKFKIAIVILITALIGIFLPFGTTQAHDQEQIDRATRERNELEQQLNAQRDKSRNLNEEISYINNQIKLRELEIQDAQSQIQTLQTVIAEANGQIADVNTKLTNLEQSLDQTSRAAAARIREAYKKSRTSEIASIISSNDFRSVMRNYEYMQRVKAEDERIIGEMIKTKQEYETQKQNLEKLKKEKEQAQSSLLAKQQQVAEQQSSLESAKAGQADLLSRSKQDESYYSNLLAQKEAEIRALSSAVAAPGQQSFYVIRGQVIAYQGNTGCSTGSHLHFGFRRVNLGTRGIATIGAGQWINPEPAILSGELAKPLSGYNGQLTPPWGNGNVTQRFGQSLVPGVYDSNGHPAVDMSDYNGAPIFAAESGWAQRMQDNGCGTGPGKGIIITHANGSQTLYWHIQ